MRAAQACSHQLADAQLRVMLTRAHFHLVIGDRSFTNLLNTPPAPMDRDEMIASKQYILRVMRRLQIVQLAK